MFGYQWHDRAPGCRATDLRHDRTWIGVCPTRLHLGLAPLEKKLVTNNVKQRVLTGHEGPTPWSKMPTHCTCRHDISCGDIAAV